MISPAALAGARYHGWRSAMPAVIVARPGFWRFTGFYRFLGLPGCFANERRSRVGHRRGDRHRIARLGIFVAQPGFETGRCTGFCRLSACLGGLRRSRVVHRRRAPRHRVEGLDILIARPGCKSGRLTGFPGPPVRVGARRRRLPRRQRQHLVEGLEHLEHVLRLCRRQLPVGHPRHDRGGGSHQVGVAGKCRQLERHRPPFAPRRDTIEADAQRRRFAVRGRAQQQVHQLLGVRGERVIQGQGALVARARRATGGIATAAGRKAARGGAFGGEHAGLPGSGGGMDAGAADRAAPTDV